MSSFSKLSITSPTSQLILILQAFHHFTYVTAHSPTLPSLYQRHSSFSNPSLASPKSQLILKPFRCFTYVTAHCGTFPSLHLRNNSFKPSVALPTSQLILQPFRCFTYVTVHSQTLLSLLIRHKLFTYVTWRAAISPLDPRFAGSNPAGVDLFFRSVIILIMTSFGREVKPWVPCRRFTTRKRTSSRNYCL